MAESDSELHLEKLFQRPVPYAQHMLVRPLCFYIKNSEENTALVQLIKDNGGSLSPDPGEAGSNIINLAEREPSRNDKGSFYSVKYVEECIKSNSLLDRKRFLLPPVTDKLHSRVRSTAAKKSDTDGNCNGSRSNRNTRGRQATTEKRSRVPLSPKNADIVSNDQHANNGSIDPPNDAATSKEAIKSRRPSVHEKERTAQELDDPDEYQEGSWTLEEDEDILWVVDRAQQLAIQKKVSQPKIFSLRYWKAFEKKDVLPKGRSPDECLERFKLLFRCGNQSDCEENSKNDQASSAKRTDEQDQDNPQNISPNQGIRKRRSSRIKKSQGKQSYPEKETRSKHLPTGIKSRSKYASAESESGSKGKSSKKPTLRTHASPKNVSSKNRTSPRFDHGVSTTISQERNTSPQKSTKQNSNSRKRKHSGQEDRNNSKRVRILENKDIVPDSDIEIVKVTYSVDALDRHVEGDPSLEAMRECVIAYVKNLAKKANVSERSAFRALRDNDGRWCQALSALRSGGAQ